MICQNCHEHEATVVITKIVGEQHSITHLCNVCANELGGASGVSMSIQMLTAEPVSTDVCDTCGKSYADFKKSGLFGCADCYSQFEKHLPQLFKRVPPLPPSRMDNQVGNLQARFVVLLFHEITVYLDATT